MLCRSLALVVLSRKRRSPLKEVINDFLKVKTLDKKSIYSFSTNLLLVTCGAGVQSGEEVVSGGRHGADAARDRVVGRGVGGVNGVQELFSRVILRQVVSGGEVVNHGGLS